MFKKAMLSTKYHGKTGDSASLTPDRGSIREISMGEITDSIAPDDHLEGPYLLKTRKPRGALPLDPTRMGRTLIYARRALCGTHGAHENFPPPPPLWISWIRHCYSMSGKLTQNF